MHLDLFCQVIDNYGDIGVCWRLAQQLSAHHPVRLIVDDLAAFARIEPRIDAQQQKQQINGIQVILWNQTTQLVPATLVIEAFGCDLPTEYIAAMPQHTELWLNLEYLSAESWVEELHLMPSPQANGISKYFFFPGFSPKTGGLLRSEHWNIPKTLNPDFWSRLHIEKPNSDRVAFVFPYPSAPLDQLYKALSQDSNSWTVLLAATAPEPIQPPPGLNIQRLPYIAQTDFDRLLDYADLNIIRGEDSFVRAIWAAKPFIWQPYPQEENTHLVKLEAWLKQSQLDVATRQLIYDWSTATSQDTQILNALHHLQNWQLQCQHYAQQLSQQNDLVSQLFAFCSQIRQKAVK